MATQIKLDDFLTDSLKDVSHVTRYAALLMTVTQNATILSDALCQIRAMMSKNQALAKMIPFVIKDRSYNEIARSENLLGYVLDHQTINFLDKYHESWLADPSFFENHIESSQWASLNPWTRAAADHLETEQDII